MKAKKFLSLALSATMITATAVNAGVVTAGAVEEEQSKIVYFDAKSAGWDTDAEGGMNIYCHIWRLDGTGTWPGWSSKAEKCTYDAETGIATYDIATAQKKGYEMSIDDTKSYGLIFSNQKGAETYQVTFSGNCFEDTLYCKPEESIENPVDSDKRSLMAYWTKNTDCGPKKTITSTGQVIGQSFGEGESDITLAGDYLVAYYDDDSKLELWDGILEKLGIEENMNDVYSYATDKIAFLKEEGYMSESEAFMAGKKVRNTIFSLAQPRVIYFDAKSAGWDTDAESGMNIYCHIWRLDGTGNWPKWKSKAEKCVYDAEKGIAAYYLETAEQRGYEMYIDGTNSYGCIFTKESGPMTYDVILNSDCFEDILYCNPYEERVEAPSDSERYLRLAYWTYNTELGPKKTINSSGQVVGQSFAEGESDITLMAEFMVDFFDNQTKMDMVDSILSKLGLEESKREVYECAQAKLAQLVDDESMTEEEANQALLVISRTLNPPAKDTNIYFDVKSAGWDKYLGENEYVYCHIWAADGSGEWPQWQSKAEKCSYDRGTGIATYNLETAREYGYAMELDNTNSYLVCFSITSMPETQDIVMSGKCLGDLLVCDKYEPNTGSYYDMYTGLCAHWTRNSDIGTHKHIDSATSNIVGDTLLDGETNAHVWAAHALSKVSISSYDWDLSEALLRKLDVTKVKAYDAAVDIQLNEILIALAKGEEIDVEELYKEIEGIANALTLTKYITSADLGDIDGDGKHTVNDVTLMQRILAETEEATPVQIALSDVDRNEKNNVNDVTFYQNVLVGLAEIA